jgi:hypothetical protein
MTSHCKMLIVKSEGKGPFGRARCRCEDNIKMYYDEIGYERVDSIHVAQDIVQWRFLLNTN